MVQLLTSFIVYHFKTWNCQVSQVSIMKLSLKFGLADYNAISPDQCMDHLSHALYELFPVIHKTTK